MSKLILALCTLVTSSAFSSGSVIGNGGDPLFYFLEATRYSLIETVRIILADPTENANFCKKTSLSPEQTKVCRDFFIATAPQFLRLNQGPNKTLFVLREEPLLVLGPDGKAMPVSARTQLGPDGIIEFHRDSMKLLAPTQTLFLLAHEFSHKSEYQGHFVTDNELLAPFTNGRELIDSVASSIVEVARRKSKVGSQYGLRDSFECIVFVGASQFGVRASSPRGFLNEDMMSYETSLSRNPTDAVLFVPESPSSDLVFRLISTEPANCSDDQKFDQLRHTEISIVRQSKGNDPSLPPTEEVLSSQSLVGYNPICEKTPSAFSIKYRDTQFSCKYFGTSGTTALNVMSPAPKLRRIDTY